MARFTGVIKQTHQYLCFENIVLVVYPQVVGRKAFAQCYHFWCKAVQANTLIFFRTKNHGLAVFQKQHFVGLGALLGKYFKSTIVEDVAVLIDFYKAGTLMAMSPFQCFLQVLGVAVHTAGNKRRIGTHGQRQWVKRMVDTAHGRTLRNLIGFRCR